MRRPGPHGRRSRDRSGRSRQRSCRLAAGKVLSPATRPSRECSWSHRFLCARDGSFFFATRDTLIRKSCHASFNARSAACSAIPYSRAGLACVRPRGVRLHRSKPTSLFEWYLYRPAVPILRCRGKAARQSRRSVHVCCGIVHAGSVPGVSRRYGGNLQRSRSGLRPRSVPERLR